MRLAHRLRSWLGETPNGALTPPNGEPTLTAPKVANAAPQLSKEETGPCGARPTTGMFEVADRRFRPARLLLPGGAGSHTWDTLGLRPGVQTIASEEMSSPTVTAPAP